MAYFKKSSFWTIFYIYNADVNKPFILKYLRNEFKSFRRNFRKETKNRKRLLIGFGYNNKKPFIFTTNEFIKEKTMKVMFMANIHQEVIDKFKKYLKKNSIKYDELSTFNLHLIFSKKVNVRKIIPIDAFYEVKFPFIIKNINGKPHKVLIFKNSIKMLGLNSNEEETAKKEMLEMYKKMW
ncbi:MAG: hypothetical protein ACP5IV_07905 [Caldisericia bacterium]